MESCAKLWDDWAVFRGRDGKLTLLLLVLLGWLQYSLWLGKNGIHDYTRVNDDVAVQQANNAKLKSRNDQLFAEIDDLNGGSEAIEERARNELGMIKPGETFYRLVPDQNKRNAQQAALNQQR
ncbi:cell division protein FtsB [Pantoea agglomerans]|uniref:cell division protein FtsB n=1 Tax=Enterobacter agglomerans TaxID=549 RepID=UPI0005EAF7DD|nr:cell division protein FtsB [Pantoea agglomerans]